MLEVDASSILRLMQKNKNKGHQNKGVCVKPLRVGRVTDRRANFMVGWWEGQQAAKTVAGKRD